MKTTTDWTRDQMIRIQLNRYFLRNQVWDKITLSPFKDEDYISVSGPVIFGKLHFLLHFSSTTELFVLYQMKILCFSKAI